MKNGDLTSDLRNAKHALKNAWKGLVAAHEYLEDVEGEFEAAIAAVEDAQGRNK